MCGFTHCKINLMFFQSFFTFALTLRTNLIVKVQTFQCDHVGNFFLINLGIGTGGEFDIHYFYSLFDCHGILFRFSCPRTSLLCNTSPTTTQYCPLCFTGSRLCFCRPTEYFPKGHHPGTTSTQSCLTARFP